MQDLIDRLAGLDVAAPAATTAEADLRRGKAALRRQRVRRVAPVATLGVVVLAAGSLALHPAAKAQQPQGVTLVAYHGVQKTGFEVATVPAGYVLQGSDRYSLDIAKATDTTGLDVFAGKIVVMLESQDATPQHTGTQVTVQGHPAWIHEMDGGGAEAVEYNDGSHDVLIQVDDAIHLTDAQLVTFAEGITVTGQAEAGLG